MSAVDIKCEICAKLLMVKGVREWWNTLIKCQADGGGVGVKLGVLVYCPELLLHGHCCKSYHHKGKPQQPAGDW